MEQPVLVILKQCLPIYHQLCATYAQASGGYWFIFADYDRLEQDPEISEAVCLNLKQGVATLQDDMRPLTQEVDPKHQETLISKKYWQKFRISVHCSSSGADTSIGLLQSCPSTSSPWPLQAVLHHVRMFNTKVKHISLRMTWYSRYGREEGMVDPLRSLLTELSNTSLTTIQVSICFFAWSQGPTPISSVQTSILRILWNSGSDNTLFRQLPPSLTRQI